MTGGSDAALVREALEWYGSDPANEGRPAEEAIAALARLAAAAERADRLQKQLQSERRDRALWAASNSRERQRLSNELETLRETDRYQTEDSSHNRVKAPRSGNYRGHDTTEVTVMPDKTNALKVRVAYTTEVPEWWRIQVRRRLGKQGLATRAECVEWLRRYGESEDDNLALAFERWQQAAEEGEVIG